MKTANNDRRGLSLVDVLMALALVGVVGGAMAATLTQTVRSAATDRCSENQRKLALDLAERLGHADSDIASLWPAGTVSPCSRVLSIDEALTLAAVPPAEARTMARILAAGGVTGVSLAWETAAQPVRRDPLALALERVQLRIAAPATTVTASRLFVRRGAR